MKNSSFAIIVALSATLHSGCDQDSTGEHSDYPRDQAIALGGLNEEKADAIEAKEIEKVDDFEISIDETLDEPLDDITSLPRPAAGFCDGYNGWNYCYAKCGDGQWHMVGHASVIPYGSCASEGDKRCGGWWNHYGSCWGNG